MTDTTTSYREASLESAASDLARASRLADSPRAAPRPNIYLAGPDVFLSDPVAAGEKKKQLCSQYGFKGVFPLDATLDLSGLTPRQAGFKIGAANEELIRSCQLVIAHLTPFRGPGADVGTVYEVGFARGLGLPVFGYTNTDIPYRERVWDSQNITGQARDMNDMLIESFDMADNLMLENGIQSSGGYLEVVSGIRNNDSYSLYRDLLGFTACLDKAANMFGLSGEAP